MTSTQDSFFNRMALASATASIVTMSEDVSSPAPGRRAPPLVGRSACKGFSTATIPLMTAAPLMNRGSGRRGLRRGDRCSFRGGARNGVGQHVRRLCARDGVFGRDDETRHAVDTGVFRGVRV